MLLLKTTMGGRNRERMMAVQNAVRSPTMKGGVHFPFEDASSFPPASMMIFSTAFGGA